MSLERYTISGRRLTVALLLVALGGAALALPGTLSPDGRVAAPAPPPAGGAHRALARPPPQPPAPAAPVAAGLGAPLAPVVADEPAARPAPPGGDAAVAAGNPELDAARPAAAGFAVGLATYRYDDGPEATLERVRPYVTSELAAELGRNSGASAGRSELAARKEVATAAVEAVQADTVEASSMDLLVVVRQTVSSSTGERTGYPSYLVRMVRTPTGWLVAGFQP